MVKHFGTLYFLSASGQSHKNFHLQENVLLQKLVSSEFIVNDMNTVYVICKSAYECVGGIAHYEQFVSYCKKGIP